MEKVMTKIAECDVSNCAYNKHNSCHTMAITVGGPGEGPHCDTYITSVPSGGIPDMRAGVGACKVSNCSYNESLECNAGSVNVGWQIDHPDCKTFRAR